MEQHYTIEGIKMVYFMPKEIDHHQAEELNKKMDYLIETNQIRNLILDFSNTEFMDSSGIGVIIGRSKKISYFGGEIYAVNLSERMKKIFLASGLHRIIDIKEA